MSHNSCRSPKKGTCKNKHNIEEISRIVVGLLKKAHVKINIILKRFQENK